MAHPVIDRVVPRALRPDRRKILLWWYVPKREAGAEIGVWKGDLSNFFLRWCRPHQLHLIDPWEHHLDPDHRGARYGSERTNSQGDMDALHRQVARRFSDDDRVTIHRTKSTEAAERIADRSLGWVYIDGDHLYEAVLADLHAYLPKIKPGGLIILDDFGTQGWWEYGPTRAATRFLQDAPVEFVGAHFTQCILRRIS